MENIRVRAGLAVASRTGIKPGGASRNGGTELQHCDDGVAVLAQVRVLSQTAIDAVDHRVDHVPVDLVSDFAGEIRRPVVQTFTWKRGRVLDAEKRRQHSRGENCTESFHLLSPFLCVY